MASAPRPRPPLIGNHRRARTYDAWTSVSARVRAFFVFGAICAVTIGLVAPGFSPPARSAARGVAVECPHHIAKQDLSAASHDGAAPRGSRHAGLGGCPDCCLAAHLGTAILPSRSASFARPERRLVSRTRYADYAASVIKPVAAGAANGARAPPTA
jgi:hypothetical protein